MQVAYPIHYACDDAELTRVGDRLLVTARDPGSAGDIRLGWVDDDGSHYLAWPLSTTQVSTVEYVVPGDPKADATSRLYDTRTGTSAADWRLVHQETCSARAGYSAALTMFATGHSMADVATKFGLKDSDAARALVHDAMLSVTRRYYADR